MLPRIYAAKVAVKRETNIDKCKFQLPRACDVKANQNIREIRECPYAYTRMLIRVYLYAYTRMLISIYELAYCCFLCNTEVECCFNGPVILGLYGLTKSLRAKYGSTSRSFTKYFKECVL